jgi:hypothetical protein
VHLVEAVRTGQGGASRSLSPQLSGVNRFQAGVPLRR